MLRDELTQKKLEIIYSVIWKDLNSPISKFEIEKWIIEALYKHSNSFNWYLWARFDFAIMDLSRLWDYEFWNDIRKQGEKCIVLAWGYLKRLKEVEN